jgi:hypothetical protein
MEIPVDMFFKFYVICGKNTNGSLALQRLFTAAVVAALLPCVAGASPFVGSASFDVELNAGNLGFRSFSLPGTYVLGSVSTTVSGLSGGSLAGLAMAGGNQGVGTIAYDFAVVGPQDGLTVPLWVTFALNVAASGTLQGTPESGASAALSISTLGESLLFRVGAGEFALSPARTNLSSTVPFTMVSGQLGFVVEQTVVGAGPQLDAEASAFMDPFIFIDAGFLSANPGFSVIVSEGIDNAPRAVGGVPEPATLAPVGLALVVAMGLSRRRRLQRSTKVAMLFSA